MYKSPRRQKPETIIVITLGKLMTYGTRKPRQWRMGPVKFYQSIYYKFTLIIALSYVSFLAQTQSGNRRFWNFHNSFSSFFPKQLVKLNISTIYEAFIIFFIILFSESSYGIYLQVFWSSPRWRSTKKKWPEGSEGSIYSDAFMRKGQNSFRKFKIVNNEVSGPKKRCFK